MDIKCYSYVMGNKQFLYKCTDNNNKFRFVGMGNWESCREFIVNEFNVMRQWVLLLNEHYDGKKFFHYDVQILFVKVDKE